MKSKARARKPILRWRGLLADASFKLRIMALIFLVVLSITLSFTQLGFAGIGLQYEYSGYAVILLLPVALASLLLGPLLGTIVGVVAGTALYLHSIWMPLDYYELSFVTPFTSIVMLTLAAFVLGILFAFALRNDPSAKRSIVYIAIVCIVVSWAYSLVFISNVFVVLVSNLSEEMKQGISEAELVEVVQYEAALTTSRFGSLDVQAWIDALLMTVSCSISYLLAKAVMRRRGQFGLRGMFGAWLLNVILLVFMASAVVSFVGTTTSELATASNNMRNEITYLSNQLKKSGERLVAISNSLENIKADMTQLDDNVIDDLLKAFSDEGLLEGFTVEEGGTIIISSKIDREDDSDPGFVYLANNAEFKEWDPLAETLDDDVVSAILQSLEDGQMKRIVYEGPVVSTNDGTNYSQHGQRVLRAELAYLMAGSVDAYNIIIIQPAKMVFANRTAVMGWTTWTSMALLLAVFALTAVLLHNLVVRRIDQTNATLARIGEGDLDARVDIRDTREFGSLSKGLNDTVVTLKGWIKEAETRMDAELATAKAIQEAALPRIFPPFPDIQRFDIYATMHAAKEVGGDFYDFFLIEDDPDTDASKLGFVIADVSGKGVPAALFMMKAKTQIRDYMQSGMEIGEAIENANRQLCDGNNSGMFVTVFAGILDYATGHVEYVNAGHNPPLVWQTSEWRWLADKSGLPLGLFDSMPYEAYSLECRIGDQLLLYTDGVTEAMNMSGEFYGEQRLEDFARKNFTLHPRNLVEALRKDVAEHTHGAEQSDDITILALEYGVPPELTATLVVPASIDSLPIVNDFIHTELDRRLCPLRTQLQLDIAVEELFVNVARYAYPDATPEHPGLARVSYTYNADPPSVRVDIADTGIPYNPLEKPDAVTPDNIADAPIGGLGILMTKRSVDEMAYERLDGSNIVTIVKKW